MAAAVIAGVEEDVQGRYAKEKYAGFSTGFYNLLSEQDLRDYCERLALLCNCPTRYIVNIHEVSSEPKTKVPKILLSCAERLKVKKGRWEKFNYKVEYRIFGEHTMDEYSRFMQDATKNNWHELQNYRFYEVDPEMGESDFRMVIIYVRHGKNEDEETVARRYEGAESWVPWDLMVPVKVSY